ncbi:NAD(P)H-binding protein [Bacillus sp. NP157]|nr:NAD(P)H-binding protein [Bacillus sp. NP157]
MIAIIGATGQVGLATARALRHAGAPVRAIVRNPAKAAPLVELGCEIATADIDDAAGLADAIDGADAVQVIAPLTPSAADPAAALRETIFQLAKALAWARPGRILAISDYGAHVPHDIGMPTLFHDMETRLRSLDGERLVLRSAEHMHNWLRAARDAIDTGILHTFQDPVDTAHPTIAASDLGAIAADLLLRPRGEDGQHVIHAEGPRRYSASDVASALRELTGREITAQAIPRRQWNAVLEQAMPASLAGLLIRANDAKNEGGLVDVEPGAGRIYQGPTTLKEVLRSALATA